MLLDCGPVMTKDEWTLIEAIGGHVPGPRHMTSVDADPETIRLVESLIEQGLVESTGRIQQLPEPVVRVCLTGKVGPLPGATCLMGSATPEARRETAGFVLPEPAATLDLTMDDGAPIRVVRHGNPSGPRVVLSHGAGFASDSYFPFWRLMLERFDLALFDFRNCGRNPFHAGETHHYWQFARDSAAVHCAIAGEWGEKTTIGVFHSMSAVTALLAVVEGVWHWDALVLFDPPMVPPEGSPLRGPRLTAGEVQRDVALIRQNRFRNPEELADVFRYLNRFRRLRKGVAELNARSVLRFDPACGDWLLCCPAGRSRSLYRGRRAADLAEARPAGAPAPDRRLRPGARGRVRRPRPAASCSARRSASTTPSCPIPATSCSSRNRNSASLCSAASSPTTGSAHDRPRAMTPRPVRHRPYQLPTRHLMRPVVPQLLVLGLQVPLSWRSLTLKLSISEISLDSTLGSMQRRSRVQYGKDIRLRRVSAPRKYKTLGNIHVPRALMVAGGGFEPPTSRL